MEFLMDWQNITVEQYLFISILLLFIFGIPSIIFLAEELKEKP